MTTTTKRELIDRVARSTSQPRAAVRETIQHFLDEIIKEVGKGHRLEFRGFGVFEVRQRLQRVVRNPRTQEIVIVSPDRVVKFKAGRAMKQAVGEPSASSSTNGDVSRIAVG